MKLRNIEKHKVVNLLSKFAHKKGVESYLVGGFVRDRLLGRENGEKDIDVLVVGDAIEYAIAFATEHNRRLSAIYKKFKTALLFLDEYKIEFATARRESYSKSSRKPTVEPTTLEEDLKRRDFTINALAISLLDFSLIDKFEGLKDLENKIIRTPLEPEKTFYDDPLRILRAIRFASQLEFAIEPTTLAAIEKMRNRLKEDKVVSQERITNEFFLILETPQPSRGINLLYLTGVLDLIFPELSALAGVEQRNDYHHKDVFYHTLEVVDNTASKTDNQWLRFAALVHDIAKPVTKKFIPGTGWTFHGHDEIGARMLDNIFQRFRLPSGQLEYVKKLVRLHLRPIALATQEATDSAFRRLAAEAGDTLQDLLILCRADITSKNPNKVRKYLQNFDFVEKKILEVQERDKLRAFQSPVRGDEIMKICNLKPSKLVGILKKAIEEAILDGKIPNEYEPAKEYLMKIKDDIIREYESKN
ncbi:MAG: CCA tRNA nucleotidyltransferase [Ignavibacteria bacterium]